jgi:uncharacterized protein (DUF2141 family)
MMILHSVFRKFFPTLLASTTLSLASVAAQTSTAEIIILISGVPSDNGTMGCALFSAERGFPLDTSEAIVRSKEARRGTSECRFEGIPSGTYAAAVFHDENSNGRIDVNVFGIPTEAWGVSNNVRPKMRAPQFDEASFDLRNGDIVKLEVRVK